MEKAIAAKQKAFKAWKIGKGTRASYDAVSILPDRQCPMLVKKPTRRSTGMLTPKCSEVYRLAFQFRREKADVVGDSWKHDAGEMSVSEDSKQKAWLEHY